jgi:peptidoglycan-associated lipoprotein
MQQQDKLYCVNGLCVQCRKNADCSEGEKCDNGSCVAIPGYCSSDADCSGSQVCRDNRCGPECRENADCEDGMECRGGTCKEPQECSTNADCASGEKCEDGSCVKAEQQTTACQDLETVYFDYDSSAIRSSARDKLQDASDCIQQEDISVQLAGHTDERGSNEYNIALGERRAQSVSDYLKSLGVSSANISTVSYGEERLARQCGTDGPDSCHEQNRRVVFNRK